MGRGVDEVVARLREGFSPKLLGLALLVPPFEVFRRTSFELPRLLADACSEQGYIAALVLGALVALAAQLLTGMRDEGRPGAGLRRHAVGALVCVAAAAVLMGIVGAFGTPWATSGLGASLVSAAAAACVGAALAVLFVGWVQAYVACTPLLVAPGVAASAFLGNLFQPVIISGMGIHLMAVVLLACLAGCAGLLAACGMRAPDGRGLEAGASTADADPQREPSFSETVEAAETDRPPLTEVLRSAGTATALGFVLCFFSWGVMAVPPRTFAQDHNWFVYFVGNLAALAVTVVYAWSLRNAGGYAPMRQRAFFLLPVFAIFVAYFSFIRMLDLDAGGALKTVLSIGFNMATPGLAALFVALAVAQVREKGTPVASAAIPALLLGCALYALGAGAFELLGNRAMYIQVVLATGYILGLSVVSARRASLDDSQVERRCAALAAEHGLSAREEEILQLVAADYSVERIAEQLVISASTVRTHKKRIYAKLDVHKHEDLMRLVRQG